MKNDKLKIAVLGWAMEGRSGADFLYKRLGEHAEITVLDEGRVPLKERDKRFNFVAGKKFSGLKKYDVIFRSQGIPYLRKEIQAAIKSGVAVTSITNIFLQELYAARGSAGKPKVIAITGTKGKGTTASMLYEILKKAKKKTVLAGNIGVALLDVLEDAKKADFVVLELSSGQLQDLKHSVDVGVLLTISKDHLNFHKNMTEYINSKLELFRQQRKGAKAYVVSESLKHIKKVKGGASKLGIVPTDRTKLFKQEDLRVVGEHNFENAVVAARIAKDLGVARPTINHAITHFKGLPHRIEFVRKIGRISFYNDSFSTIPASVIAAIKSFDIPIALMIGGRIKIDDYSPLRKALRGSKVKSVLIYGEDKKKLAKKLAKSHVEMTIGSSSMHSIVSRAYTLARNFHTDSIVLFSPGATSFDMFKNATERGEKFKSAVLKLPKS